MYKEIILKFKKKKHNTLIKKILLVVMTITTHLVKKIKIY